MSVTSLRPIERHAAQPFARRVDKGLLAAGQEAELFGIALMRAGHIDAPTLMAALSQNHVSLLEYLVQRGHIAQHLAYDLLAAHWAIGRADFARAPIDTNLLTQIDPAAALAQIWVPWRRLGAVTVIVCADPLGFETVRRDVTLIFGQIALAIAPRAEIEAQIIARAGHTLARRAETRLPEAESCRSFEPKQVFVPLGAVLVALLAVMVFAPLIGLAGLVFVAVTLAYALSALKWAATLAEIIGSRQDKPTLDRSPPTAAAAPYLTLVAGDSNLPMISLMVPLYRESRIVARLIRRLEGLDYPRRALEVILLTEDNDAATAKALSSIALPPWVRILTVPSGTIRTKPRALNYGLDHCKGEIIGVYDAEDAPSPNQLKAVAQGFAQGFAQGDTRLGCLQGRLDYYNPRRNWMARCFTMEYATWWRVVLPGYARLGLPIPLGGTTLFFRREVLVRLGGWDAHNVTEDADLGLRLARKGYHTQLLDSTTFEEANAQVLPWIKQRSRWIKGYIMTYVTHMRDPIRLWKDLGFWNFAAVQMLFAGPVLHALFAPLLFLLWTVPFGVIDPSALGLPSWVLITMAALGVFTESVMIGIGFVALRRTGHDLSPLWLPTMMFYNLLASLAAYKAVYEVLTKPFYWDKTAHGLFDD